MKKILFLIVAVILSACAASPVAIQDRLANQKSAEQEIWDEVVQRYETECNVPKQPVKNTACLNGMIEAQVLPVAEFPNLVLEMMANMDKTARGYERGDVSSNEYEQDMRSNFVAYYNAWDQAAGERVDNAYNNQRALAIYSGALAAGAQGYSESRQEQFERQQTNQPVTVQCTEGLGTYHCQQY